MIWGNAHGALNENKQDTVIWKKQLKWWKWLSLVGGIMAFYIFFFMLFPSFLQRECIPFVLYYEKAMRKEQKYVKNRLQQAHAKWHQRHAITIIKLWETLQDKPPSSSAKHCKRGKGKGTQRRKEMLNIYQPISYGFHLDPDLTKPFKGGENHFECWICNELEEMIFSADVIMVTWFFPAPPQVLIF